MSTNSNDVLTIALSKGRILEETLPLLEHADILPVEDVFTTRKLMVDGPEGIRFLIIRAADVCTYVERGAADMGIVGRDLLLEWRPQVFEPLDLKIGACRLCVAGPEASVAQGKPEAGSRVRIATKYDYLAKQYYMKQSVQADIIHLYGSMELAPLVGMADRIFDVVSTGGTLRANGLVEEESLYEITSRLIVNPVSFAMKKGLIQPMIEHLREAVALRVAAEEK
ncbi:MAG: ATP phosphoribosyltransferase [Zetaproteobacteria bacterium]|nr:ATP phosphoribosyltransferase [Zetaproteobacteria bacterium]